MEYEVVDLKEMKVVGVTARTKNMASDMEQVIGNLWNTFYKDGIYASITDKVDGKALGIYTDYECDEEGEYTAMVACQVANATGNSISNIGKQDGMEVETTEKMIPAGKYAKFVLKGPLHQIVTAFWEKLWKMDLPRTFQADFEEYQNGDMENAEIHIYIGIKAEL